MSDLPRNDTSEQQGIAPVWRPIFKSIVWSAGRTSDAVTIGERVATRRVEVLGEDHPDTLTARLTGQPSAHLAGIRWTVCPGVT